MEGPDDRKVAAEGDVERGGRRAGVEVEMPHRRRVRRAEPTAGAAARTKATMMR